LFGSVLVPPAVIQEVVPPMILPSWIKEQSLVGPQTLHAALGPGEQEAILLALQLTATWVVLDDRLARRLAHGLGLGVIGTLGVLLAGKRRGFLPAVKPCLDALTQQGFHIAGNLYKRILADAGESP